MAPSRAALPQLRSPTGWQSTTSFGRHLKGSPCAAVPPSYGAPRPKLRPGIRPRARAASAAALGGSRAAKSGGSSGVACNENTAALIYAFTQGAFAGERMGERSQLVRRLESEVLAMVKGTRGARPATSPLGATNDGT